MWLNLFGSPQIRLDGVLVEISSQKALALLVYLALGGRAFRRDLLAALLWPDYAQSTARAYLRQALHELTKELGHRWFMVSRENIGLAEEVSIATDVGEFRQLLAGGGNAPDRLRQAVALYANDFLAGFSLPDCPEFEQWQLLEAESLRHEMVGALQQLMRWYTERRDYAAALEAGRRWLALTRYDEGAHRLLMQLYVWMGQPTAALRQYEECKKILAEELQTMPEIETQQLYAAIRSKRLPSPSVPPLTSRPPENNGTGGASPPPGARASDARTASMPAFVSKQSAPVRTSTFVAREWELEALSQALATARDRNGQILFVIGGAGRGKTMLVQEFARRAQADHADLLVASGTCNAYTGTGDPYLPFREILMALAGDVEAKVADGLTPSLDTRRLWEAMPTSLPALVQYAPDLLRAFAPLELLLARAESFAPSNASFLQRLRLLANETQRLPLDEQQLLTQFTDALKAIATHQPLLLILEDLHWIDAASNSMLLHLSRMLGESRILVVGTYRPDELAVGGNLGRHPLARIVGELKRQHGDIWLDIGALSADEGQAFVDAWLDTQPNRLDAAFRAAVFEHTGGHALFTVELLREMQARGELRIDADGYWVVGEKINWSVLPAKVEGVIEQRIGRLTKDLQGVLAVASIEGESFTAEVVAHVRGQDEFEVVQLLSQELAQQHRLVRVESVGRAGQQRLTRYRFRHHLFQHYLYNRLTESERAYLHEKVGVALESIFAGDLAPITVQLAHHFEQASLAEKAMTYLGQAGQQAYHLSANQQAIQLLRRALTLLAALPATPRRAEQELALCLSLGRALQLIEGLGSANSHAAYQRAYELCQQVGNVHDHFVVVHGLNSTGASFKEKIAFTHEMLQLAETHPDPLYKVSAHHVLGHLSLVLGHVATGRMHLEQSIALYDQRQHHELLLLCGQDEGICAIANMSWALWLLGYPDQALQCGQEGLLLAEELAHPISVAVAKHFLVYTHLLRGEAEMAHTQIDALLELANEQGFGFVQMMAASYRGWALRLEGKMAAAIEQFERVRAGWQTMGLTSCELSTMVDLAEAYGQHGEIEHGLSLLDEVAHTPVSVPSLLQEAIYHRVRGELLFVQALTTNVPTDASTAVNTIHQLEETEAAFMRSIETCCAEQAKSLELQATLGLCRLWQHQGKIAEARAALAEIYGWFTEGFDTADLLAAKALLAELTAASRDPGRADYRSDTDS